MATFEQFINSIIADGNDGKAFEQFCKHFLETSPEFENQFDKVWMWDDWPNKWSRDKGIDLVAKYRGRDRYCAIQAKCYGANNTVPYSDVTNFLADSSRAEIEHRILMMSTNKLAERTTREVIAGQEKGVTILDRNYFENVAKFDYPEHISQLQKAEVKDRKTPLKYQGRAIDDVVNGFEVCDRGKLIMACGTGKTLTTLWIKEHMKANTVLVLLPSLSLLSQTMREWVWEANQRFDALAVCSDPTVGRSNDDISTADVGRVTWQVEEIQAFLHKPDPKVIFCTYQSSQLIQHAQEDESIPKFDLVICDEAHRCAGNIDASFATVLHDEKIRARKRLFTTATPRYYGKSITVAGEGRGIQIAGMDDEAMFGTTLHTLTFGQAIEWDLLTDYQVVVVGVDEPMVREWISEGEIVTFGDDNLTDARTLAAKIAVLKAIKDFKLSRVISFHGRVNRARDFSKEVSEIAELIHECNRPSGKIWSEHVSGEMTAGKRRDLINGLRDLEGHDIGLLTNARCLSEGVDVPSLDGVAFVDPRGSQVDIIQSVGRAIRKSKSTNKNKGTIVLPVFLESGDDPDDVIDASNFKPIWDVLKALRAHDEVLADELDQFRTNMGLGVTRKSDRIEKIIIDVPTNVSAEFASALTTQVVEATTESWKFWYGLLRSYVDEHGHCRPEANYKTKVGHKLGRWVVKQRQKKDELSLIRKSLLEDLDGWVWSERDAWWQNGFEEYRTYVKKYNSVLVAIDYITDDNFKLGGWVRTQRSEWDKLSDERRVKLEEVGFSLDPDRDRWLQRFREYKEEFDRVSDHDKLSSENRDWAGQQRGRRKKSLNTEQIELLESLSGWAWDKRSADWEKNFGLFREFVLEFGHAAVPMKYEKAGAKLGVWVNGLRQRKEKQSVDRLKRLNGLGFIWNTLEAAWENNFNLLKKYKTEFGTLEVPKSTVYEGEKLGTWVYIQRRDQQHMDPKRRALLDGIGFRFEERDALADQWDNYFKAALSFKNREGHLLVKKGHLEDNLDLATWISTQRSNYKKGKLDDVRVEKLDAIGMVWDVPEHKFNIAVDALLTFKAREGHINVPHSHQEDGYPLGAWVNNRKTKWDQMSEEHQKRLLEIGLRPSSN